MIVHSAHLLTVSICQLAACTFSTTVALSSIKEETMDTSVVEGHKNGKLITT